MPSCPEFAARRKTTYLTTVVNAYSAAFGITKSRAEARRLIEQGSVQLDGNKIVDPKANCRRFYVDRHAVASVLRLDKTRAVRIK